MATLHELYTENIAIFYARIARYSDLIADMIADLEEDRQAGDFDAIDADYLAMFQDLLESGRALCLQ